MFWEDLSKRLKKLAGGQHVTTEADADAEASLPPKHTGLLICSWEYFGLQPPSADHEVPVLSDTSLSGCPCSVSSERQDVRDVDQSDADHHKKRPTSVWEMDPDCIRYHLPEGVLLDNFGIHRDPVPPEPEPQPLGWIVRG